MAYFIVCLICMSNGVKLPETAHEEGREMSVF